MKILAFVFAMLIATNSMGQELYAATEPASNMAARSVGFRIDQSIMDEISTSKINYHVIPELMVGISKEFMIHANTFFSNRTDRLQWEGASIYGKYRFFSRDAIQTHFRLAGFARLSYNNSDIHQEEINMNGHNTGWELGIVATQLIKKVAVSSSLGMVNASDNGNNNKFVYGDRNSQAVNYTFSIGKLMLPKEYKDYRQTNLNLMVEFLSQFNTGSGKYYADIAPSIQLIINSQSRVDVGYRRELGGTLIRTAPNGVFVRLEYNWFNAF